MRCTFCATGKGGFARNLKPHEIIDQVLHVQTLRKRRVSHVGECETHGQLPGCTGCVLNFDQKCACWPVCMWLWL
jgi:adenine C2-methylase RlmN of 23S rRNA A2503 and tRNA A37